MNDGAEPGMQQVFELNNKIDILAEFVTLSKPTTYVRKLPPVPCVRKTIEPFTRFIHHNHIPQLAPGAAQIAVPEFPRIYLRKVVNIGVAGRVDGVVAQVVFF